MSEEEIDIIELLRRVKEGKAPKEIEIGGIKYHYNERWEEWNDVFYTYLDKDDAKIFQNFVAFDTKIKILDKPIIEEIPLIEIKHDYSNGSTNDTYEVERAITNGELANKINEIIRHINNEENANEPK